MLRRDSLLVSSNQRKQMATKLTDDFAVEVLSQLLFKAFCRFKCVYKAWIAFSSDPHYCQKLLKFPLVLCTIAALLLMEELMELLIYRHSTSSFVLLTGLIAKSFFQYRSNLTAAGTFSFIAGTSFIVELSCPSIMVATLLLQLQLLALSIQIPQTQNLTYDVVNGLFPVIVICVDTCALHIDVSKLWKVLLFIIFH